MGRLNANAIFEEELSRRGLSYEKDGEDSYRLRIGDLDLTVNLENVRRNAERDDDPDAIRRFVDHVVAGVRPTPAWADASRLLFFSAEPATQDFGDSIRSPVTDEVCRVMTLSDTEHSHMTWVTPSMCAEWGVSVDDATAAALRNQDGLIRGVSLKIAQADGHKLGMVPIDTPYKASVIFAPAFKQLVATDLGWPVLVFIPCRDFVYVVEEHSELLGRVGTVVVEEFPNSGYPLTTEVLRVSDDGIEAIGHFPA